MTEQVGLDGVGGGVGVGLVGGLPPPQETKLSAATIINARFMTLSPDVSVLYIDQRPWRLQAYRPQTILFFALTNFAGLARKHVANRFLTRESGCRVRWRRSCFPTIAPRFPPGAPWIQTAHDAQPRARVSLSHSQ